MDTLTKVIFILIIGCINNVLCETVGSSDLNELTNKLQQNIPALQNFSSNIQNFSNIHNLSSINPTDVPNLEEVQNAMKKKCDENGGPGTYEKIEVANDELKECFGSLLDMNVLQDEIESAKKTGSLDVVFGKYCDKVPQFENCVKNYTDVVDLCLDAEEKKSKKVVMNVTKSLSEFVCHKSGDRIAMFIAEGGPECITDKQNQIQKCANQTIAKNMPADLTSFETLPMLVFKDENCAEIKALQECIVTELQGCKDPTPSNIVESLFKFIIKMTPCYKQPKSSAVVHSVFPALLIPIILTSFFKLF